MRYYKLSLKTVLPKPEKNNKENRNFKEEEITKFYSHRNFKFIYGWC